MHSCFSFLPALFLSLFRSLTFAMNTPAFTTDPHRIERLRSNYEAGATRERMPSDAREREECQLIAPSAQHIQALFSSAAVFQQDRSDAAKARKEQKLAAQLAN